MANTEVSAVVSAVERLTASLKRVSATLSHITAPVKATGQAIANFSQAAGIDALGSRFRVLGGTIMGVYGRVTNLVGKFAGMAGAASAVDRPATSLKRIGATVGHITAPVKAARQAIADLGQAAGIDALGSRIRGAGGAIKDVHGRVTGLVGKFAGMAGLGNIGGIGAGMLKQTIGVSAQFENFEAVLATLQGSSAGAKASMNWIADFAVKTPYGMAELTDSFIKLKSYGIDPMDGTMKAVSDAAAATGKPIGQMVEALANGVAGDLGGLKSLGIKSSTVGDIVSMAFTDKDGRQRTFKAAKTDAEAMQAAILAIFEAKGFDGAMGRALQTWDGMWSKLTDSIPGFWKMVGDAGAFDFLKGKLRSVLDLIQRWQGDGTLQAWAQRISDTFVAVFTAVETTLAGVNWEKAFTTVQGAVESVARSVRDAVAWIGGWENAAIAVAVVMNAGLIGSVLSLTGALANLGIAVGTAAARVAAMAFGPVIAAVGNFVTALRAGYGAMTAFNLAMAANPIGAVIAAVAVLGAAVYGLYTNWDKVGPYFQAAWEFVKNTFAAAVDGIMAVLGIAFTPAVPVARAVNAMVLYFTGIDLFAIGSEWISGLIDGIKGKWGELTAWLSEAMQSLTGWLPDWAKDKLGITAPIGSPTGPAPANDASSAVTRVANSSRNSAAAAVLAASMAIAPVPVAASPAAAANPGRLPQTAPATQLAPVNNGASAPTRTINVPVTVSVVVNGLADVHVIGARVEAAVRQAMAEWQAAQGSDSDAVLHDY